MAEAGLSLGYADLRLEIAAYLGYGTDSSKWTAAQSAELDRILKAGLRQYYDPPIVAGRKHEWSFLSPTTSLSTVAATEDYTLPDDFGGMEGDFTFDPNTGYAPVRVVNEGLIRFLRQTARSGRPYYAAIRPKNSDGSSGQRFEALFYPTPDAAYVLSYRKRVLLNALSTANPYPLGGMMHAETILAACLAAAEDRLDDGQGPKYAKFLERLAASMAADMTHQSPDFYGNNGDNSDGSIGHLSRVKLVTVNGVTP